jgi:acyl-CoA synthetase (AMP-forming)/AMP-acid ligase II
MKASLLLDALELPATAMVNKRVPKTMLQEHGAATAADKRQINEGIEQLLWVAALKPTTIGVAAYRDELREVLEIAVLQLTLRAGAKAGRLIELVHRAVPYPVLLVVEQGSQSSLSLAPKRWSQAEAGKTVLEGDVVSVGWDAEQDGERWPAFRNALGLGQQPGTSLETLYQGWIDTLLALQAARLTGAFAVPTNPEQAGLRREALQECSRLAREIARLRATAAKEKQMARRVELNLELKRLEAAQAAAQATL